MISRIDLAAQVGQCVIENNVIELIPHFNNRDSSGKLIPGVIGTAKQDELTTVIEDAAILSML